MARARLLPGALAAVVVLALLAGPLSVLGTLVLYLGLAVAVLGAAAYLVWNVHPGVLITAGLVLSVFAGNWGELGVPGFLAPDRLLFLAGIGAVLLRAPTVRDRPRLDVRAVHWLMVVTVLWFVGSALAAGTITERSQVFELVERLGVIPFLLFLVAPVAFAAARHRRMLLAALVGLGAYLGFTALMETLGIDALVLPSFINDASIGTHTDRARGPFLEAVTNGVGLFVTGVAAAVALAAWRAPRARAFAGCVLALCAAGLLFTETRSVWLGGAVATIVALLAFRELRRYAVPALAGGLVIVGVSIALIPGFAAQLTERQNDNRTVWDRKNLATAAVNMVEDEPLVGIGFGRFTAESADYFRVSMDYPLTADEEVIHNAFLTYAAETGLIGVGLWVLVVVLGVTAALGPGAAPAARPWQLAVGAYLLFFLVISNFVFPQVFPNTALWLLAGVAVAAADRRAARVHVPAWTPPRAMGPHAVGRSG